MSEEKKPGRFARWMSYLTDDKPPAPPAEEESSFAESPSAPPPPAPVALPEAPPPEQDDAPTGWWGRLKAGLTKSSSRIGQRIGDLFTKKKLDAATLDELEDALIEADLGVETATRITDAIRSGRYGKDPTSEQVREILAEEVEKALAPVAQPLVLDASAKPFVILMVGVNGSGKTTTIGKLAKQFMDEGRKVMLAAGDTFRAAAIEQLKVWGERNGAPVVSGAQGADASGLVFDAITAAKQQSVDVLLVDTAGRLQNKAGLMDELAKIVRVMKKVDPGAPHAVLLVLDATVGQNALQQVEIFGRTAGVTGLVMTKLDGTARGGILVAIAAKHKTPIHFIGVGERADDLQPFAARDFARAIAGLDQE
ncbi:MAG: signal recognition particle-docking protein FtsY [Rhizobiales bacterium 65-9]|nr:signal recognition particle-docking protein FtsY [Hyphomicrobiales bacterium]OJY36552.1 MAG: signal recognition particle-docking protein FtsY [Rhizobiales bacterium 65-9]